MPLSVAGGRGDIPGGTANIGGAGGTPWSGRAAGHGVPGAGRQPPTEYEDRRGTEGWPCGFISSLPKGRA